MSPRPRTAAAAPTAPLLTLQQVGEILTVGLRTLQSWRATGKLRVVAFSRRCIRVEQAELDRLIAEARQ